WRGRTAVRRWAPSRHGRGRVRALQRAQQARFAKERDRGAGQIGAAPLLRTERAKTAPAGRRAEPHASNRQHWFFQQLPSWPRSYGDFAVRRIALAFGSDENP